jgi:CHAT domain-containing protein/Tfp pilus assembly protein PilF
MATLICPTLHAQETMQEADQLGAQVVKLAQLGRYQEAIPLAQRALAICEKLLGPNHEETAGYLNDLAELYFYTKDNAAAEPLYERALTMRERVLGPKHPDTALTLNDLATLHVATGHYAKAEPLYQRALAIREEVLGPDHSDTAASLNGLAVLYGHIGARAKAEPLFGRAFTIYEKTLGPENPNTARVLYNLAKFYEDAGDAGDYVKAEALLQRALMIFEKTLGTAHPETTRLLMDVCGLYLTTGAYGKGEPFAKRALAIIEGTKGPEDPDTARALENLAFFYRLTGDYVKAEPLFERALAIFEKTKGAEDPDTAGAVNNLAGMYRATGAFAKAEALYKRTLAALEKAQIPVHSRTATVLNNLGVLYQQMGAYVQAETFYKLALGAYEKELGPEHRDTARALNNLAGLYQVTGDYLNARVLFERALTIRDKALGVEHPDTAATLNDLAVLYQAVRDYASALPLFERALAIREKVLGPAHPETALSLDTLANMYYDTGDYGKAAPLYERAQAIEESNTVRFLLSGSEARKQAYLQERAVHVHVRVSFSIANPTASGKALGLTSVLQFKGRVLDAMSDSVARLRRSVALQDQALFDQLSGVAQNLSTMMYRGREELSFEAYRERLDTLAREQERLEQELSSRSAAFHEAVTPITLDAVRQALPADGALVEWFRYAPVDGSSPRYAVYVVMRGEEPVAIDLGVAQPIEDLVAEFRTVLSDPKTTYFRDVAQELSDKLIKPLHPYLAQRERLFLSPDGPLNLVPFAALVDGRGEYLAQHYELTYLTSGRDLLHMASESPARGDAVVVANPNFGQRSSSEPPANTGVQPTRSVALDRSGLVFEPLAGTAAEAEALQALLKLDVQNVLTGDRATEAQLRELHGPRILHVATHGFFLNDQEVAAAFEPVEFGSERLQPVRKNPLLRSGLALAGANARRSGATDDGILTAAEAAQLDLLGTQLVVLSACQTGVGTVQMGEGVYGLRRALVLSGAQAQVISLWKVDDAATRELMVDYYQRLLKGAGRSAALRASQNAMMADPARRHPYYWGAFIAAGNWTPLPNGR